MLRLENLRVPARHAAPIPTRALLAGALLEPLQVAGSTAIAHYRGPEARGRPCERTRRKRPQGGRARCCEGRICLYRGRREAHAEQRTVCCGFTLDALRDRVRGFPMSHPWLLIASEHCEPANSLKWVCFQNNWPLFLLCKYEIFVGAGTRGADGRWGGTAGAPSGAGGAAAGPGVATAVIAASATGARAEARNETESVTAAQNPLTQSRLSLPGRAIRDSYLL